MSCLNKYKIKNVKELGKAPQVIRKCPKCKKKTHFINTMRFRVNANKNRVDVWLIYQCSKCKSTWNMTIYERINPKKINEEDYEKFLSNDEEFAMEYGANRELLIKNKAEII